MNDVTINNIIKNNLVFFTLFLIFLLLAQFFLWHNHIQGEEIFWLDAQRKSFLDIIFQFFTLVGEAYSFVIAFFVLLFFEYRKAILIPIAGGLNLIITYFSKHYLAHPRPMTYFNQLHIFEKLHPVEGVDLNSGFNSFPSGHTLAAFTLFSLLALLSENKTRNAVIFFSSAALVAVSRMYLIQHFLEDVLLGSIVGTSIATAVFYFYKNTEIAAESKWNQHLKTRKLN